jgi:hypothetical protein
MPGIGRRMLPGLRTVRKESNKAKYPGRPLLAALASDSAPLAGAFD